MFGAQHWTNAHNEENPTQVNGKGARGLWRNSFKWKTHQYSENDAETSAVNIFSKRIFQTSTQISEIGLWLVDKPSIALAIWTRWRLSFMFSSSSEEELADCTLLSLFCSSSMAFWCCCILSLMLELGGVFSSDVEHMWKQYGGLLVDGSALVVDK